MRPASEEILKAGGVPASARRLPRHVTVMRRLSRQLPPARYRVAWEPALPVPAADGSTLLTDHYLPVTGQPGPAVLLRSPYGRGFPWDTLYGLAFAEQGFHVIIQSCRGTGGSGGTFRWCHDEGADGLAAVAWLRRQKWFNGRLGTVGPSYFGYTQWALAAEAPPELKAMVVQVGMHRPYDGFYPGGVFALDTALIGGIGTAYWQRGMLRMAAAATRFQLRRRRITRTLPLTSAFTGAFGDRLPVMLEWLSHTEPGDPYWQDIDLSPDLGKVTVPTALAGGWYDIMLDQTVAAYRALRANGQEVSLLIGPWTHTSMMNEGGTAVFGDAFAWLRGHLCGDPADGGPADGGPADGSPADGGPAPVRVYVGGCGQWRNLPDWPPPSPGQAWYLHGDLHLGPEPAGESRPTTLRYDPAHPTPAVGGQVLSYKPGPQDNNALEARPDVLTFTSPPLAAPLEIIGTVRVDLQLHVSYRHAHVFARLCDVDPRGRSRNVCDSIHRLSLAAAGDGSAVVVLSPAAYRFAAGHRLRLQLSGGAFPRFARNTGTDEPLATGTLMVPTNVTVHHSAQRPSALLLPATTGHRPGD
jgi:uncharacterized protein